MLIAFRCLSGLMVASTTLNDGTIGDMFPPEQRGGAISLISLYPLLGIITGPIIGGYLTAAAGWRWTFWIITIATGVVQIGFLFLRETYARGLPNGSFKTGKDASLLSDYSDDVSVFGSYLWMVLSSNDNLTEIFESQFNVSQGPVGLTFIGIGIGMFIGAISCTLLLDKWAIRAAAGGAIKPEYRLPVMVLGGMILPIGFVIYGWTAEKHVQ
ncbi:hypothetical protein BTUL_0420g00050 [Botrytis tulipae]|uniref:Major facilitator superfamily (MFS) profile domain-containing protein n=1 Tax=Botrytis tulipae TaxID=87230 RepID=A0A4Z1E827_9HELO|nr:hypothetical protein BTUL_0420g00050 [Botrytis tulipae]